MTLNARFARMTLKGALCASLLLALGGPILADKDYGSACHDRLNSDKIRIDRDAMHFGERSKQVQHDVDKMEADRSWCRSHHAEWDHATFDVGIYLHK